MTTLNLNMGVEPPTIDPNLAIDEASTQVVQLLFMGLVTSDLTTLEPKPWLAQGFRVSADGLVWTFDLRRDVPWVRYDPATDKVEKKRFVNAHDIVYSVRRALDPQTASDYAHVDYLIVGAEEVNRGTNTDLESIGVRALDDYTVQFTLNHPASYFPLIAGMWTNNPVPREAVEQHDEDWTEPGTLWTCGAYVLSSWEHEHKMVMKRNPHWFDAAKVHFAQLNWAMIEDTSTAFAMYEAGELDVSDVPPTDLDRVRADATLGKQLNSAPILSTYYYGFNTTKAPFDQALVRRAFSLAIDRQKLVNTITKGGERPAKSFASPGVFGSVAEDPAFAGVSFDPAQAQALLAAAGYPGGKGLPAVTLMYNDSEEQQHIAEFMQQTWKEVLGVEVRLSSQEFKTYLDTLDTDPPQVYRMGWDADYPDENNWVLENFHPRKSPNRGRWAGAEAEEFARLTDLAAAEANPAQRKAYYAQAEKLLCADAAVMAPIYHYTRVVCTRPHIQRTYAPLGGERIYYWKAQGV
jgi:oligopeptide transport system substrate-binding protein